MLKSNNSLSIYAVLALILLVGCDRQNSGSHQSKTKTERADTLNATKGNIVLETQDSSLTPFPHAIDGYKASEMCRAIYQDSLKKFTALVFEKASVESCLTDDTYIYDALYAALVFGKRDIVEYVVQNKLFTDINVTYSEDAETPLTLACSIPNKSDGLNIAKLLIANGAKVDGSGPSGGEETKYPLIISTQTNNVALTQLLIQNGADKNVASGSGATAISIATDSGFSEIIELLK